MLNQKTATDGKISNITCLPSLIYSLYAERAIVVIDNWHNYVDESLQHYLQTLLGIVKNCSEGNGKIPNLSRSKVSEIFFSEQFLINFIEGNNRFIFYKYLASHVIDSDKKESDSITKRRYAFSLNKKDECLGREIFDWYKVKKVHNQVDVMEFLYQSLLPLNNGVVNKMSLDSMVDRLLCLYGAAYQYLTKVKLEHICFTDGEFFKKERANVRDPVANYEVYESIMTPPMLILALINSLTLGNTQLNKVFLRKYVQKNIFCYPTSFLGISENRSAWRKLKSIKAMIIEREDLGRLNATVGNLKQYANCLEYGKKFHQLNENIKTAKNIITTCMIERNKIFDFANDVIEERALLQQYGVYIFFF